MKTSKALPFPSTQSTVPSGNPAVFWMHPTQNVWVVRDAAQGFECWYDFVHFQPVKYCLVTPEGEFSPPRKFEA
jgi:hypothetical protein